MSVALFRETAIGQIIRHATKNRYLKYPEELPDFVVPEHYCSNTMNKERTRASTANLDHGLALNQLPEDRASTDQEESEDPLKDLEKQETFNEEHDRQDSHAMILKRTKSRADTLPFTEERFQVERTESLARAASATVTPVVTAKGEILVDWYTTDDPSNPQNWSSNKKYLTSLILCMYTFAVYSGSSIYTPAEEGVIAKFGVSAPVASLGLALYVLGYGMGPLLFSPLSEIARFGRNPSYVTTYAIFTILCIPTALVNNIGGLLLLRFLQGFFGSPCLATAPATFQDMYSFLKLPYVLAIWTSFSFCGPAVGPILSGFAVPVLGWRWSIWEMLIISGPVFVFMFLCLPETSSPNILLRRAKRLRALTGNERLRAQSEIDEAKLAFSSVVFDALIKPIEITFKDPSVAYVNMYSSLIYGIYYSFFEAFPVVYADMYGFNLGLVSTTFLCILVACLIAVTFFISYLWFYLEPDVMKNGLRAQEHRLVPALFAAFGLTAGLFIFAWTSNPKFPWIASVIGITLFAASGFVLFQCIFIYIPLSYPQYAASLFASNDFFRSALACGAIMFARPLYANLGIGRGVSVLAGCSALGIVGMFILYFYGATLRSRSRFTIKQ